jgi:hypothetical protein
MQGLSTVQPIGSVTWFTDTLGLAALACLVLLLHMPTVGRGSRMVSELGRPAAVFLSRPCHIFTQQTELNAFFDALERGLAG